MTALSLGTFVDSRIAVMDDVLREGVIRNVWGIIVAPGIEFGIDDRGHLATRVEGRQETARALSEAGYWIRSAAAANMQAFADMLYRWIRVQQQKVAENG